MTDIQIFTLSLTVAVTFVGVLTGVLLNNNRLNDLKELLRAEIDAGNSDLTLLIEKHHSELMMKFLELEYRMDKLEAS